ncbi:futalosine hydrolase [Desulfovibrio sp. OttesenSCG-928-M16]|nr:futalosine hydrolase [Desulfovibrio sp. OttesenSCG-928-M16]
MDNRTFLVACATFMEMRAFFARLPGADTVFGGFADKNELYHGLLPRLDLTPDLSLLPLVCGVGPVAAALSLGRVLGGACAQEREGNGLFGLIITGLAGAYDPIAAPVGSLVLAQVECLPEYGLWPDAGEGIKGSVRGPGEPETMTLPQWQDAAGQVFERLDMAPDKTLGRMGLSCHSYSRKSAPRRGVSLTVAGVSGTPGRARRLASLFQGLTENMEGFPLALGARQAGLPCLEIRAVSNEAGFRPPHTWNPALALEALGEAGQMLFAPDQHI